MTFTDLGLVPPILKALDTEGYTHPTPIQAQSIPILLRGKDLLGCAQTGTGKTAAFAIPILQLLYSKGKNQKGKRKIKALVLTPTRELAIQIGESFTAYGRHTGIRNTVIFGGVKQGPQTQALQRGIDVLIATPGRLLDLIGQGYIDLRDVEYSVLDEADRMLDMGFIHDIKKIIAKLPEDRQSLFFSATMAPSIVALSKKMLGNPERVTVRPEQTTAERVDQAIYFVAKSSKIKLLKHLIGKNPEASTLVFSRTKHGANKIVKLLKRADIEAAAIHGNKSQGARQRALSDFKDGKILILVATDIAARGIDVEDLACVINYDLPNLPETYVHRIGRTGRASASGVALSFCNAEERAYLKDIEKLIKQKIPVISDHPFTDDLLEELEQERLNPAAKLRAKGQQERSRKPRNPNGRKPKQKSQIKAKKAKEPSRNGSVANNPNGNQQNANASASPKKKRKRPFWKKKKKKGPTQRT